MSQPQNVLAPIPAHGRYLELVAIPDTDPRPVLQALAGQVSDDLVIGLGAGLVQGLGAAVPGLHAFRALSGPGVEVPATQADLLCWIRGEDRGVIATRARELLALLAPAFRLDRMTNGFKYATGLDLSGYEDGTENPEGAAAVAATLVAGGPLAGSSFMAVQKWVHDLAHFDSLPRQEGDNIIGRRRSDNVELEDAPQSAHTKRTAQESFTPEAFVSRRSMPFSDAEGEGLLFVAFGRSFDAFEAQMKRMSGLEDGITDGLFRFSRPVSGANYWCPPVRDGRLDLAPVGL